MKKKCFAVAFVVLAALLLLLAVVCMQRGPDVNAVLSRAGFAKLPESARNVRVDSQGSVFGRRVTLVSFGADPAAMRHFVETSPTGSPELRGVWDIRFNAVDYPSWWTLEFSNPGLLRYRRVPDRPDQAIIVDCVTNAVYIRLNHR